RKPRDGCEILPSPFRPHVAAVDRLRAWTSPYALDTDSLLRQELSPSTANTVQDLVFAALEPSTLSTYAAGLLRFHQFCDAEGIPEGHRMPASPFLLAGFVSRFAGTVSGKTVAAWLAGLHAWHDINCAPWEGDQRFISLIKMSAAKRAPASSKREKRAPVTIEHLFALQEGLDFSSSFDCAVWAVACIAFWACCRLGELTVPSKTAFDPRRHVTKSAAIRFRTLPDGSESAHLHLPFGKMEKDAGVDLSIPGRPLVCAVAALRLHQLANRRVPPDAPLFAFETADGSWAPMVKSWFLGRCRTVWEKSPALLSQVAGHSFRIGGATELLLAGVPPETVAAQGRWKSLAFLL
ncbi:hypothetical protein GLOTRDRAFT_15128, partial [Gloeophyllum trabeum ATCC 11539]